MPLLEAYFNAIAVVCADAPAAQPSTPGAAGSLRQATDKPASSGNDAGAAAALSPDQLLHLPSGLFGKGLVAGAYAKRYASIVNMLYW
jgi:hypothetical protein